MVAPVVRQMTNFRENLRFLQCLLPCIALVLACALAGFVQFQLFPHESNATIVFHDFSQHFMPAAVSTSPSGGNLVDGSPPAAS